MMMGRDVLESIFEDRELQYYTSRTSQLIRRNGDHRGIACGNSARLRNKLRDVCDLHARCEVIDDSLVIHGLNPPGPVVHIEYDYRRGFPYPTFTPVL